ncbi:MAG: hypothetical protein PHV17_09645 [Candidatus Omnitrophica bacterium]|nr:hypothetical protein [Candidatus Omnitrophota bacterium]
MVKKGVEQYKLNDDGSFVIENYSKAFPFANFLPGIAGVWGVPLWVFSVNRAQAVMGFGLADKDHAITEFYPANKAYSFVSNLGFRTFIKINGSQNYEPFSSLSRFRRKERMIIRSESLEIVDENIDLGLKTRVKYFGLPNASVSGLLRIVDFENLSGRKMNIEVLDGLPRIIPFGSNHFMVKELARTLEAWMRALTEKNLSLFNLVVDPGDVSETKYIEGANFHYSFFQDNGRRVLPAMVVDPDVIFAEDKSYAKALRFESGEFSARDSQIMCGKTPCSFAHFKSELKPGDKKTLYNVFGASPKVELIKKYVLKLTVSEVNKKEKENCQIVSDIKENALCGCADNTLSHYIQNTYLDNVLRGGYPLKLDGSDVYYVYSRKHGDLERDYNRFKLIPSCFSEGEANYRDINQNRRQDLFFNPFIGESNLIYFLNLIKINGYNPLIVQGEKLVFNAGLASTVLKEYGLEKEGDLAALMKNGFYLGEFFNYLNQHQITVDGDSLAKRLLKSAERIPQASFGEGYWVDHWRYNLDLLESILTIIPIS